MKKLFLLWLLSTLLPSLANAIVYSKNNPPGCDTLLTMSGKTYLVVVGWQGNQEIQYQLCGDESGRVYSIQRDSIRDLRQQKQPSAKKDGAPNSQVPVAQRYKLLKDTFDLLTLSDGKTYRVIILVRDYLNTYYRMYDDPLDDREYCVLNRQVRSVRLSKARTITAAQKKKGSGCLIALAILGGLIFLALLSAAIG